MLNSDVERMQRRYAAHFKTSGHKMVYAVAPGRVNLLGEHTDYNDGFVLPMAIEHEVRVLGGLGHDDEIRVVSMNYDEEATISLADLTAPCPSAWANYVRGVVYVLQEAGYAIRGMNLVIEGNVPAGAGLSSSAALEIATLMAVAAGSGVTVDPVAAAQLAQRAENEIVGVQCGIMDQFASRLGRRDAALLLDCRTLEYEIVPFGNPDLAVVIVNSNVRRGLVDSAYNERREACQQGARLLGVTALRDVSTHMFAQKASSLPETVRLRSQHVVEENARVLVGVKKIKARDYAGFGELMYASHVSLRDLFAVSTPELDLLVDIARSVPGVLGSRLTGAGFGGSTVTLLQADSQTAFIRAVQQTYPRATGLEPDVYVLSLQGGGAQTHVLV